MSKKIFDTTFGRNRVFSSLLLSLLLFLAHGISEMVMLILLYRNMYIFYIYIYTAYLALSLLFHSHLPLPSISPTIYSLIPLFFLCML